MKKIRTIKMRLFFLIALLNYSVVLQSQSQNRAMILAPKYLDVLNNTLYSLPTSTTPGGYNGQAADFAQNIQMNAAGTEILFFIVDEEIYNKYGVRGLKTSEDWALFDNITDPSEAVGISEICVIPDPGNCNQYYILAIPIYANAPLINKIVMPAEGSFDSDGNALNNNAVFDPFYCGTEICTISDGVGVPIDVYYESYLPVIIDTPGADFGGTKACTGMAVTKLRSDGSRILFIQENAESAPTAIYVYKIGTSTIQFMGMAADPDYENVFDSSSQPELEVIETSVPNEYRLAWVINNGGEWVMSTKFNINSLNTQVPLDVVMSIIYDINLGDRAVASVEFSPNGRYLYMLNTTSPGYTTTIFSYYDFQLNTWTDITSQLPNATNYQYSELELGYSSGTSNKLFLTRFTKYMQIGNPNTPASLTFTESTYPGGFTHPKAILQDQIDGMNYSTHFLANTACCLQNTAYSKVAFTATTSATWTPGSNPIGAGAVVTIGNELRIPAGKVVTIDGMTIKFAPDAKLIIESGTGLINGGRLVLKNTTLTVDTSCGSSLFWGGVEVWGVSNLGQGSYSSGVQGWLKMDVNSTIEKAEFGVLCAKRNSNGLIQSNTGGGVVQGGSSTISTARIRNCRIGANLQPYSLTSVSIFERFTFETTQVLLEDAIAQNHLVLSSIQGVNIKGCTFQNTLPSNQGLYETTDLVRGIGIFSVDANYRVDFSGTTIKTKFINLAAGIYAFNFGGSNTYSCKNSLFTNCVKGIYNYGINSSNISFNIFNIYPMLNTNSTFTSYGLFLNSSTGYTVSGNTFYQNATSTIIRNVKGLIVQSSGEADNLIYNNSFYKLKVGAQVIGINGAFYNPLDQTPTNQGLVLKCNNFQYNFLEADMAYTSASVTRVAFNQGNGSNIPTSLAGNRFSHSSNNLENDIYSDAGLLKFDYNTNIGPNTVVPSQYDNAKTTVFSCCGDFNALTNCPAKPVETPLALAAAVTSGQSSINTNMLAAQQSGALIETELQMNALDITNLNNLSIAKSNLAIALNEQESYTLRDNSLADRLASYITILSAQTDIESQRRLAVAYWEKGNTTALATVKTALQTAGQTKFVEYLDVLTQIGNNNQSLSGFSTDSVLMGKIKTLSLQTVDVNIAGYADVLYNQIKGTTPVAPIIPALVFGGGNRLAQSEASSGNLVVYPNPVNDFLEIKTDNQGRSEERRVGKEF